MSLPHRVALLDELTAREVHDLYQLRVDVFIVEQQCPYREIDDTDLRAHHLLVHHGGALVACARVFADGGSAWIGRVVVTPGARGSGLGHRLVDAALAACGERWPELPVSLNAQSHLTGFYADHGFTTAGAEFLDAGVPHTPMIRGL